MGDKDNAFKSILEGMIEDWHKPFLMPIPPIEDPGDLTRIIEYERLIMPGNDVPIQTFRPPKDRMPSFNFDILKKDMEHFRKMLEEPLFKEEDTLPRLRKEVERRGMTLIIECEPTVNKPNNLKYPHKKRKKRVLKKWAKRFGTTPNQLVVPENEVEWGMAPNEEGILCHYFRIKPKKQP